jgi:hypothetical protein
LRDQSRGLRHHRAGVHAWHLDDDRCDGRVQQHVIERNRHVVRHDGREFLEHDVIERQCGRRELQRR